MSIKNLQDGLGVQNIFDLVLKGIYSIYKTKNPTEDHKMTEREIFEKYANLSENELNAKSNKDVYAKNDVMITVIKRCRGERKIDGFKKKLMIPDSETSECLEHEGKPKIGKIFVNEKILE